MSTGISIKGIVDANGVVHRFDHEYLDNNPNIPEIDATLETAGDAADALAAGELVKNIAHGTSAGDGTFAVGDLVSHGAKLYRCIVEITEAEVWTPAHWTETTVAEEMAARDAELSSLNKKLTNVNSTLKSERLIVAKTEYIKKYSGYSISGTGVLGVSASYDVLLFKVADTGKVIVTDGSIYAFYNVVPVENVTSSINSSRTVVNLHSTEITVPNDAIYIAVRVGSGQTTNVTKTKTSVIEDLESKTSAFAVGHDVLTNFIDLDSIVADKYINGSTGQTTDFSGLCCTDFIELEPSKKYYCNEYVNGTYYAFYDADKAFVSGYGTTQIKINEQGYFIVPSTAKYGRFSFNSIANAQKSYIAVNSGKPKPYDTGISLKSLYDYPTDYNGGDISVFNKILCIGDSLTYGGFNNDQSADISQIAAKYCYPVHLHKITGVDVNNVSQSGLTSVGWYSTFGNTDLSGHDCCIIQLGVNDVYLLNGWTTSVETAFENIISKIKTENKNIKIFVASTIHAQSYYGQDFEAYNTSLKAFVESLSDPNVVYLDIYNYGHLLESKGYNAGHLSAYGYWRLAKDYANYISWYVNGNRNDFRWIQFIGTDLTYSGGGSNHGTI